MPSTAALGTGIVIPVDLTSRDYLSIRADLLNAIPSYLPEWTSTAATDFGVALVELFAYSADIESYYIDRIANESFLATAQQRSSVLNLAYLIDYAPADATAASVVLSLTQRANTPSFILPKGAQFSTAGTALQAPLIFELAAAATVPANGTANAVTINSVLGVPLTVVQGVTVTSEPLGTSNGNASQTFTLFNTNVIDNSVQVFVDEGAGPKPWSLVAHLIDAQAADASFAVAIDANGITYVNFGDNANGRIPNTQAIITATYRIGGGAISNVGANQIVVDLTNTGFFSAVTNPGAAAGGADPETIAQIQINAPKSLTAAGRCVSVADYAAVARQVAGVSKASAGSSASASSINLYVHPAGGPYTTANLGPLVTALGNLLTWGGPGPVSPAGVSGYLDSRKMVGTNVVVLPPTYGGAVGYVPIVLTLTISVKPQYANLQTQQDVMSALNVLFDFGSVHFGQRLTISSVYHTVQEVPGVDYLTIQTMSRGDAPNGTLGDIVCAFNELPVVGNPNTGVSLITVTASGGL